jgi:hypothetical protein
LVDSNAKGTTMSSPRAAVPAAQAEAAAFAAGRAAAQAEWTNWLASTEYGHDYAHTPEPPCTGRELAEAYMRRGDSADMTADTWLWCMQENTGSFLAETVNPDNL